MITTVAEALAFREKIENAARKLSDEEAINSIELFPKWSSNNTYVVNARVSHNSKLYKAINNIDVNNETWTPDVTPTLWQLISDPSEAGTIDNPITAEAGLTYEKDKYYSEGNKIYLCTREDTEDGTILYYLPSQLVGVYFEEVIL